MGNDYIYQFYDINLEDFPFLVLIILAFHFKFWNLLIIHFFINLFFPFPIFQFKQFNPIIHVLFAFKMIIMTGIHTFYLLFILDGLTLFNRLTSDFLHNQFFYRIW